MHQEYREVNNYESNKDSSLERNKLSHNRLLNKKELIMNKVNKVPKQLKIDKDLYYGSNLSL